MTKGKPPSERLYKYHRRQWKLYLLFCVVMAVGTVIAVLLPGDNRRVMQVPVALVFTVMFALHLIVRARNAEEYRQELRRISQDEWIQTSLHRSQSLALLAVIFGQVPLMFFMAYLPPESSVESSVVGMGVTTVALGCGVMAAGYLYFSRERVDG